MLCFSELNFEELKEYERIGVAYSGGLDSHVLLHLIASKLDLESIYALHVNHGMSKYSDATSKFTFLSLFINSIN